MRVVVLVCVVGCGSVEGDKKVDASVLDTAGGDAAIDAPPDAPDGLTCTTEMFDGTALQGHWSVTQGGAPTYAVTGGKLIITDSPLATTPSNTNESWLNNLDTDKGNQLSWAHGIGGQDFRITAHVDWVSTGPQIWWAAIAAADAQGIIAATLGPRDGGAGFAIPHAQLHVPGSGSDTSYGGTQVESGGADFRIERTSGVVKFYVNGTEVHAGTSAAIISHVSIVHVPYRLNTTNYEFGTAELTHVEVCK